MVESVDVGPDRSADSPRSERPGPFSRLGLFVFGVVPSDTWRAPKVAWVGLGLSGVLLLVSHAIRHWGWRLGGLDAATLATVASIGGNVLLFLVVVGLTIARVRQLMAPSTGNDPSV